MDDFSDKNVPVNPFREIDGAVDAVLRNMEKINPYIKYAWEELRDQAEAEHLRTVEIMKLVPEPNRAQVHFDRVRVAITSLETMEHIITEFAKATK